MVSKGETEDESLIARYVSSFGQLDALIADEVLDPIGWQLADDPDQYGYKWWRPTRVTAELSALDPIYSKLPGRFPPLFERLALSYRWAEVDLQSYRLLANPPGPGLGGLLQQIQRDPIMWKHLLKAGFIQFGKGPDIDYDPVCFDISSRKKNEKDCRIVKIDHELILCGGQVEVVAELAPSFRQLMLATIDLANQSCGE